MIKSTGFTFEVNINNVLLHKQLVTSANMACWFWNCYIMPRCDILVKIGEMDCKNECFAIAYEPNDRMGKISCCIDFNCEILDDVGTLEICLILIHHIGHALGIGSDIWTWLFDKEADHGLVQEEFKEFSGLKVGSDTKSGLCHWDKSHDPNEIMTEYRDRDRDPKKIYISPLTIKLMKFFGHGIDYPMVEKNDLIISTFIEKNWNDTNTFEVRPEPTTTEKIV
jgi:hypothetical protein